MLGLWLFLAAPQWLILLVLAFLWIGILPLGRNIFEGKPYNISMASAYGDLAIIAGVLISADIANRNPQAMLRAMDVWEELFWALALLAAGFVWNKFTAGPKGQTKMDAYHNMFILPGILWLAGLHSVPIIRRFGSQMEQDGAIFCALVWLATFLYDAKTGRLNQTKWLKETAKTGVTQV